MPMFRRDKGAKVVSDWLNEHRIVMHAAKLIERPDHTGDEWDKNARHYIMQFERVVIVERADALAHYEERKMSIYYSMGSGLEGNPKAVDVLSSMILDIEGYSDNFSEWCSDYGYSDDSIKARKTWEAIVEERDKFIKFFTPAEVEELINMPAIKDR
jgi:hypothetical protein